MWRFTVDLMRPIPLAADFSVDPVHDPVVALVGANGAGKSTLLKALAGFLGVDQGGLEGPPWDRPLAWVPQEPVLLPHRTIRQQTVWVFGGRWAPGDELSQWIDILDLGALLDVRPVKLSGGQQQRAALLRALASRPKVLALDESLSQIDAPSREGIASHLRRWAESEPDRLLILTTHQFSDVSHLADRVLVMKDGAVLTDGDPSEVIRSPGTWDVASLVGYAAVLDVRGQMVAIRSDAVHLSPPGHPAVAAVVRPRVGGLTVRLPVAAGRSDFWVAAEGNCAPGSDARVYVRGVPIRWEERG